MSSIHSPDDDLNERWKAAHDHPQFAQIPGFEALDLGVKAHAHDAEVNQEPVHHAFVEPHVVQEDISEEDIDSVGGVYDDGPHTPDEQIGHDMLHEEYQQFLSRPTVIDIAEDPLD